MPDMTPYNGCSASYRQNH